MIEVNGWKIPAMVGLVTANMCGCAVIDQSDLSSGEREFRPVTVNACMGYRVALEDLDDNETLDLLVHCRTSGRVGVMLGNGKGQFGELQLHGPPGTSTFKVGRLDNADNYPDLVAMQWHSPFWMKTSLGNGQGGFSNHSFDYEPSDGRWADMADFDQDGNLDVVLTGAATNRGAVSVWWGNGTGRLTQGEEIKNQSRKPYSAVAGDFNSDGAIDIAAAAANKIDVYLSSGDGRRTFTRVKKRARASSPAAQIAAADFNGDQSLDLVVPSGSGGVRVYHNTNNQTGSLTSRILKDEYQSRVGFAGVATGDFNHDGDEDFVASERSNDGTPIHLRVFLGDGKGQFDEGGVYPVGQGSGLTTIATGDVNNDDLSDVVVSNMNEPTIYLFLGQ